MHTNSVSCLLDIWQFTYAVHGQLTTKWSKRQEFMWLLQHYLCLIPACSILWLMQELSQNRSHWL
jgi:hypothetical protein